MAIDEMDGALLEKLTRIAEAQERIAEALEKIFLSLNTDLVDMLREAHPDGN
jgi:hypothetical protein